MVEKPPTNSLDDSFLHKLPHDFSPGCDSNSKLQKGVALKETRSENRGSTFSYIQCSFLQSLLEMDQHAPKSLCLSISSSSSQASSKMEHKEP